MTGPGGGLLARGLPGVAGPGPPRRIRLAGQASRQATRRESESTGRPGCRLGAVHCHKEGAMAKRICTVLGVVFLLVGLAGFAVPGALGMHLSPAHNVVHLVSG